MIRQYRGTTYEVAITKPKGIQTGKVSITLDGQSLEGNVVPPLNDGKTHKVAVTVH
jgi:cellobiose phosphorylase